MKIFPHQFVIATTLLTLSIPGSAQTAPTTGAPKPIASRGTLLQLDFDGENPRPRTIAQLMPGQPTGGAGSAPMMSPVANARRELHVSANGSDANDGTSPQRAFATLKKAAQVVQPGDTVLVGDGIYSDADTANDSSVVTLTKSGRPDAWITWKARSGQHPELRPMGWNGFVVAASYQILDGFTIVGSNDSITLKEAIEDTAKPKANPRFNTNGIGVNGGLKGPNDKPHHIIIRNCIVTKCGGGGIFATQSDYITIEDCQTFDNSWYARYANSGISTIDNWAHDDKPGYHYIIQRNRSWNNRSLVPWLRTGKLSDGNGIILDVADQVKNGATNPNADAVVTPAGAAPIAPVPATAGTAPAAVPVAPTPKPPVAPKAPRPIWKGRSLVANNLSAYNGGSGIHTFRTSFVDIVNNTTYWNGQVVGYEEIFSNQCTDVVMMNNIIVPRPGGKVTSNYGNTNVRWDYNIYPGKSILTGPTTSTSTRNSFRFGPICAKLISASSPAAPVSTARPPNCPSQPTSPEKSARRDAPGITVPTNNKLFGPLLLLQSV